MRGWSLSSLLSSYLPRDGTCVVEYGCIVAWACTTQTSKCKHQRVMTPPTHFRSRISKIAVETRKPRSRKPRDCLTGPRPPAQLTLVFILVLNFLVHHGHQSLGALRTASQQALEALAAANSSRKEFASMTILQQKPCKTGPDSAKTTLSIQNPILFFDI